MSSKKFGEHKQIAPGMWAWDIPEEKRRPNEEFVKKVARESGQETLSATLLKVLEKISRVNNKEGK